MQAADLFPSVVSPVKCVKNEIHNILTVLRLTKQFTSNARFHSEVPRDSESPVVRSFQQLFDSLTYVNEFHIDITHLDPFLSVIRSPETNGPITAVALAAINKFVAYGLIHPDTPGCAAAINAISEGVLNCRFHASGTPADEVVLLKILGVLVDTLRCPAGEYLSDDNVWLMIRKCYQISRQPRASYLLRSSSENILLQMVLTIFGCHKTRRHHVRLNGPNGVIKPYGVECMYRTLRFLAWLTSYGPQSGPLTFSHPQQNYTSLSSTGGFVHVRSPTPPRSTTPPPSLHGSLRDASPRVSGSGRDRSRSPAPGPDLSQQGGGGQKGYVVTQGLSSSSLDDVDIGLAAIQVDEFDLCQEMRSLGLSLLNVALETGGDEVAICDRLIGVVQDDICKSLLQNSRTDSLFLLSVTLRCVFNLFQYFKKHLKVQLEIFFNSIHLRIANLPDSDSPVAFEERELALESLLEFCREPELMRELYENYDCDVRCTNLFERLVRFLAKRACPALPPAASTGEARPQPGQAGALATKDGGGVGSPSFTALHRLALSGLLAIVHAIAGKCHFDISTNQRIAVAGGSISPNANGQGGKASGKSSKSTSPLGKEERRREDKQHYEDEGGLRVKKEKKRKLALGAQVFNSEPSKCLGPLQNLGLLPSPVLPEHMAQFLKETPGIDLRVVGEYICKRKDWNTAVRLAFVRGFNFKGMTVVSSLRVLLNTFRLPGESQEIERIMDTFATEYFLAQSKVEGLPPSPPPPEDERKRNKEQKELTKEEIEKLEQEKERERLRQIELHTPRWAKHEILFEEDDFEVIEEGKDESSHSTKAGSEAGSGVSSVASLYEKEDTQGKGDKEKTGWTIVHNSDAIFVLAYSIIMLNTDLHNPQVKKKMSLEEFKRNNRGINDGKDFALEFLERIYSSIRDEQIRMDEDPLAGDEDDGLYWDKLMRKQEKVDEFSSSNPILRAGVPEREMFAIMWDSDCLQTVCSTFEASHDQAVLSSCLHAFLDFVRIGSYFGMTEVVDAALHKLCGYSNVYMTARSQMVMPAIFHCISQYAHLFRDAWADVLEFLLRLYTLDLLPPALTEFDDFTDPSGRPLKRVCDIAPPLP